MKSCRILSFPSLLLAIGAIVDAALGFTSITITAVDPTVITSNNNYYRSSSSISNSNKVHYSSRLSAVTVDLVESSSDRVSFRSRVKGAFGRLRQKRVEVVEDIEEFKKIISDEQQQNLVAVMFYSPVCKACQATKPLYQKLAQKYTQVRFISIPMTKTNSSVLQSLGIRKFPFGQIYDPQNGLVDELGLIRRLIPSFEDKLQSHISFGERTEETNQ